MPEALIERVEWVSRMVQALGEYPIDPTIVPKSEPKK
jgi:hypothetical protein